MNDPSNPLNQLMRIQIDAHADLRAAPRSLFRGKRWIDIIEIMDQWYGPDYRYVKVRAHNAPEGSIITIDYKFPKPGTAEPVLKQTLETRIGNQGCGVTYYK
jgi:hypothetical protein